MKAYELESLDKIKVTMHWLQLQNTTRTRSVGSFPVFTEFLSKSEQKSDGLRLDNNKQSKDHLLIQPTI